MGLSRGNLRDFEKDVSPGEKMLNLPLEAIDLVEQLGAIVGFFCGANELEAEQNWRQWIAKFVSRDSKEIIASLDRLAQLCDQFVASVAVGGLPGVRSCVFLRGIQPLGLRP